MSRTLTRYDVSLLFSLLSWSLFLNFFLHFGLIFGNVWNHQAIADAEEKFNNDVAELQANYAKLQADKDSKVKSIQTEELKLLKGI